MELNFNKIIFPNIAKKMLTNKEITLEHIANKWEIKVATAKKKLYGDIGISLSQCEQLVELFGNANTIGYYFKRN